MKAISRTLLLCLVATGCRQTKAATVNPTKAARDSIARLHSQATGTDANGVDAPVDANAFGPGFQELSRTDVAHFVRLPAPPATAHPLVCDLLAFRGDLYVSHAVDPLDRTGARIHRLRPLTDHARDSPDWQSGSWSLALDWNRGGRPDDPFARGGEGFTRLRVLEGAIFAPDADSPGPESFGVTDAWVENLVLRSLPDGNFPPLADRPAGALVQPWSYHAFDIIEYHGSWVVSGGLAMPLREAGGGYPAALWVGGPGREALALQHIFAGGHGVVRATYMHRFAGRLFIGMQNNQNRLRFDLAVLSSDPADPTTAVETLSLTPGRGYRTRSMVSTESTLYWLGERGRRGPGVMFRSDDGASFRQVALPAAAGAPQDLVIAPDGQRYLLTRRGLWRSTGERDSFTLLAPAPAGDPFGRYDGFCGARLIAIGDALIAGSMRDGSLYQLVAGSAARPGG